MIDAQAIRIVMRLDPFVIAVRLHKLPYTSRVIVRASRFPVVFQEIFNSGNIAIVASGKPIFTAEKWQVKGELIPEGHDGMIIAGYVLVLLESELGPEDGGPQQDRGHSGGIVAGNKGGEGERCAVAWVAHPLTVGVAAAIEIHGPFAAACQEHEQDWYQCPVFHDSHHYSDKLDITLRICFEFHSLGSIPRTMAVECKMPIQP